MLDHLLRQAPTPSEAMDSSLGGEDEAKRLLILAIQA